MEVFDDWYCILISDATFSKSIASGFFGELDLMTGCNIHSEDF
jgi:hypothetical protein